MNAGLFVFCCLIRWLYSCRMIDLLGRWQFSPGAQEMQLSVLKLDRWAASIGFEMNTWAGPMNVSYL